MLSIEISAQIDVIDFESDQWVLRNAEIVQYMGRKCLMGMAYLKDVEFENGIIEVDMAVNGSRSYPGIIFRMQNEKNYERFYIRPHRAGLYPDALQYTPVINGIAGWQLYNGEGFTAGIKIPKDQWIHLKMEIFRKQARLFIDGDEKPALVIHDLKHGISKGTIGLFSPRDKTAYFSNFKYKFDSSLRFESPPKTETPPGVISEWELSQAIKLSQIDIEHYPSEQERGRMEWRKVSSEPSGLVDIARYIERVGREPDCALAKTSIQSNEDQVMMLQFGYSDVISIFLNGKILFFGNSAYRKRDPSFLGIVGYNDAVYLPLKKGENELLLMVAEGFGGWGFMCKDGHAFFEHEKIEKSWEIDEDLKMPESAVYDKKRNVVYVTNYDAYGIAGRQFISKISLDGKIQTLKWVEGLAQPSGVAIFDDRLYVVERRNVVEIELESAKILNRFPIPKCMFPNDIAIDSAGDMYVSDSMRDVIYKFSQDRFEVWLEDDEVNNPNGLFVFKDKLIVGLSGDHSLKSIDLQNKKIHTIVRFEEGIMDGIKMDEEGNVLLSHYEGRLYRVSLSGEVTKLLDLPDSRCADFDIILERNLIIIPALDSNKVMAYQLKK